MKHLSALVVPVLVSLVVAASAAAHALPIHKRWSKMTLKGQERYVKRNIAHAKGVLRWVHAHRGLYAPLPRVQLVRVHKRLLRKARRNLREIEAKLHPPFHYPWWWVPLGICETGVNPPDPAYGAPGHPGGDGYEGWINFLNSTWLYYGGGQFGAHAYDASEYEQYIVTMRMHADVPWSQSNPACSARIGM